MLLETIVAPATPMGRSALAIVRLDGPESGRILTELSREALPEVRRAVFTRLWTPDGKTGTDASLLDECVAVHYAAPHSFTGNDLVELTLHGNPLLVDLVLEACVQLGARLAEPGELSERAVLNGKIDLVQAESIADLINARTALQAKLSLSNLEGVLSRRAVAIRQTLLEVISRLEAALDFSEEGYEFITRDEAAGRIGDALREVSAILETWRRGRATTTGLSAVILGRPNAGKSTLLNLLVGSERAIVTPIPGTTRDIVRETIEIGGLPVTLADTAGLRASRDVVEGIGIERARQAAQQADLILYLVDSTQGLTEEDRAELAGLDNVLLVHTKADLAESAEGLAISAVTGAGVDELLARLDALVRDLFVAPEGSLVNERQRAAMHESKAALETARESLVGGKDEQLVLVDLYRAASALALLTGAITRDDILREIFGKFCIGK